MTATPADAPPVSDVPEPHAKTAADRIRAVGNWARDTGLGITGFTVVLIVALAGWTASFIGLHQFGMAHMALTDTEAWLVPVTFDGAAGGLSLVVFRASIHGRGAALWRMLIIAFTGLSSWINWVHLADPTGRWIACYMPPSAVILFEGLMSEARAAAARRSGSERPRVHPLRWFMDRSGTWAIYRSYVLGIELPEALQEAAGNLDGKAAQPATEPAPAVAAPVVGSSVGPGDGSSTEHGLPVDGSTAGTVAGNGDSSRQDAAPSGAGTPTRPVDSDPVQPSVSRRQKPARSGVGRKAPRRPLGEWVEIAGPVFHDEFRRLKRMPTANEFAAAIKAARLGTVSDTTAKTIRAEILDRTDVPALD